MVTKEEMGTVIAAAIISVTILPIMFFVIQYLTQMENTYIYPQGIHQGFVVNGQQEYNVYLKNYMLFIFPNQTSQCFWNKNTKIPLTIAWINNMGYITTVQIDQPYNTTPANMCNRERCVGDNAGK